MTTQNKNNNLHNESIMIQDITNLHTPVKDKTVTQYAFSYVTSTQN